MNINLQNRQQLLTVLAIGMIGILVADRVIISPLIASWHERAAKIVELRKSVAQGRQMLERDRAIRDRWKDMQANALPNSGDSAAEGRVLKAFDDWSRNSGIAVSSIKPQWKHPGDDYSTLECRVDASGTLPTITQFLFLLEKDSLALKVDAVEITARDTDGAQLNLGLQVSGLLLTPQRP